MSLHTELKIETPEGIQFSYSLAGPVSRCLAWIIDLVIIAVLMAGAGYLLNVVAVIAPDFGKGLAFIAYFVISIGYGVLLEWMWRGQTVGKWLFRLRVIDVQGLRLQFHQILMRNLLRAVDCLPGTYLIGGIACACTRHAQRLGDLAAGTAVIHLPRRTEPDLEQLLAGKFNSLRAYPQLAGRLRQRVSAPEAVVALQALLRREDLEPAARVALFGQLAKHFHTVVQFPEEALESMPDEQFIRNVVDILFRTRASEPVRAEAPTPAPAEPGMGLADAESGWVKS